VPVEAARLQRDCGRFHSAGSQDVPHAIAYR
jgi:hypothetical protein